LIKILNIILKAKENLPKHKEFGRAIKKLKEKFGFTPDEFYSNLDPAEIISLFEKDCKSKTEEHRDFEIKLKKE
jgi:hypothetical protein